jgi:hypothetical protein
MMNSTHCRSQPRQSATTRCSWTFQQECSTQLCPSNIVRRFSSHYTPYTIPECGRPLPHRRSVLLATDGPGHNSNGQGLLVLPAGQGSQTRPPTTSRDTGTAPPFHPHPRRPGRAAAALTRQHLPFHHNRLNLEVAGSHSTLIHHHRRLRQGPLRRLGISVWSPCQGGPVHVRPVGRPVQPTQHPALAHDIIPSPIERIGRAVP